MSSEQKQLLEFAIQDVVVQIATKESLPPEVAMDTLYHSTFFKMLNDTETGLYRESAEYLYRKYKSA